MLMPKTIRRWLAVFRGDVAPSLIVLSTLLGFWFGLTPGFYGVHVALLVLALVLNINVGIFILSIGVGKAVSLAAAPLLYHTGAWAQRDLAGLLTWITSAPILGVTDVARYAVAGSLVVGPVVGLVLGGLLALSVQRFRKRWLRLEENSEAFQRWMSKGWVKLLARLLVGKGTASPRDVLTKRVKYVRLAGVLLAVGVTAAAGFAASLVSGDSLSGYARQMLTSANGAEVDIARLDFQALKGRISAGGIAATDPDRPTHNRLEVDELTADVSFWELLRGRAVMDEVVLSTVALESARQTPGRVVRPVEPVEADTDTEAQERRVLDGLNLPVEKLASLDSYFKDAQKVRRYLQLVREWLPEGDTDHAKAPEETPPTAYLEYLNAVAPRSPTPRFVIRKLIVDNATIPIDGLGRSKIECANLTDAPSALSEPVVIDVTSSDHSSSVRLTSDYSPSGGTTKVAASFADFDLAKLQDHLKRNNTVVFQGGRASATIEGTMNRSVMDLTMGVKIKDMKATATGGFGALDPQVTSEAMKVLRNLETTLRIVGPTTHPRLVLDSDAIGASLRDALVEAGKDELARRAGEMLDKELSKLGTKSPELNNALDPVKGLLGGDKNKKPEGSKKQEDDLANQAEKALGGLFDKNKKKKDDDG